MGRRESNLSGLYSIKRSEKLEIHSKKRQEQRTTYREIIGTISGILNPRKMSWKSWAGSFHGEPKLC